MTRGGGKLGYGRVIHLGCLSAACGPQRLKASPHSALLLGVLEVTVFGSELAEVVPHIMSHVSPP